METDEGPEIPGSTSTSGSESDSDSAPVSVKMEPSSSSSALEALRKLQKEFTRCSICFDVYRQPKMLPCLHTFCLSCLERYRTEKSPLVANCPLCRGPMPQTAGELSALPVNFLITRLLEIKLLTGGDGEAGNGRSIGAINYCDQCREGSQGDSVIAGGGSSGLEPATMYCVECHEKLCVNCVTAHRKMKLSKGHQLVDLGPDSVDKLDQVMRNSPVMCSVHGDERIDFYCENCSLVICMKCCMLQHKDHIYKDITEVTVRFKTGLESIIDTLTVNMSKFKTSSVKLGKQRQRLTSKTTRISELVEKRASDLKAEIDRRKEEMLAEVHEFDVNKTQELDAVAQDIEVKVESLETFREFCQQLKDRGTNYDIVQLSAQFIARAKFLQDMSAHAEETVANVDVNITYKAGVVDPSGMQSEVIKLFGRLTTKNKPDAEGGLVTDGLGQGIPKSKPQKKPPKANKTPQRPPEGSGGPLPSGGGPPSGGPQPRVRGPQPAPNWHPGIGIQISQAFQPVSGVPQPTSGGPQPRRQQSDPVEGGLGHGRKGRKGNTTDHYMSTAMAEVPGGPGSKTIQGIAILNSMLFVVRRQTPFLEGYDARDMRKIMQHHIHGLIQSYDMASSPTCSTLYISEFMKNTVHRVEFLKSKMSADSVRVSQFTTGGRPFGLSVTADGNILIGCPLENQIQEYRSNGTLVRVIPTMSHRPRHVIEVSSNQFVLVSGDSEVPHLVSKLCLDATSGQFVFRAQYGGDKVPARHRLNDVSDLVMDQRNNIFVVDRKNNCIIGLRSDNLYWYGGPNIVGKRHGVASPTRMCLEQREGEPGGSLYVGTLDGRVIKFNLNITEAVGGKGEVDDWG